MASGEVVGSAFRTGRRLGLPNFVLVGKEGFTIAWAQLRVACDRRGKDFSEESMWGGGAPREGFSPMEVIARRTNKERMSDFALAMVSGRILPSITNWLFQGKKIEYIPKSRFFFLISCIYIKNRKKGKEIVFVYLISTGKKEIRSFLFIRYQQSCF